jgi:hypothetical protein
MEEFINKLKTFLKEQHWSENDGTFTKTYNINNGQMIINGNVVNQTQEVNLTINNINIGYIDEQPMLGFTINDDITEYFNDFESFVNFYKKTMN